MFSIRAFKPDIYILILVCRVTVNHLGPNYCLFTHQYIRDFYHEDPESYSGEIHKLEALRATAVHPANDVTGCSVLKKYYCQLHFLQSRFPMGKDGAASVNFSWLVQTVFNRNKQSDLHWSGS